jgi:small multidrug resistance pump
VWGGCTPPNGRLRFTKTTPSVLLFLFYLASFGALTLALKKLDVSVAYATWSGVGTALIAGIGFLWFQEEASPQRVGSLLLIVLGVVGLHLSGGPQH